MKGKAEGNFGHFAMNNLGFKKSLTALALCFAISLLIAVVAGIWQGIIGKSAATRIYEERTAPTVDMIVAVDALHRARQTILIALSEDSEDRAQAHLKSIAALDQLVDESLEKTIQTASDQKADIQALAESIDAYNKARNQSIAMIQVGDLPSALENIKANAGPKFEKVLQQLEAIIDNQGKLAKDDFKQTAQDLDRNAIGLIVLFSVVILASGGMFFVVIRGLMGQMGGEPGSAREKMRAVAGGNLAISVGNSPKDSVLWHLDEMTQSLSAVISDVKSIALSLDQQSHKTLVHTKESAERNRQQADAATGVAAGVEELAASIESVADNAMQTERAANESLDCARDSRKVIESLNNEMSGLSIASDQSAETIRYLVNSSENIISIVKTIRDIADQTNLLALNAAIEAARAGEQGRGFAVVADEVRKLAEKTGMATKEINEVLHDVQQSASEASSQMQVSHDRIKVGAEQVAMASSAIQLIESNLEEISIAARDTAVALSEQRSTGNSISQMIEQIAVAATENSVAASVVVSETKKVAEAADELKNKMSQFHI